MKPKHWYDRLPKRFQNSERARTLVGLTGRQHSIICSQQYKDAERNCICISMLRRPEWPE